MSFDPALFISTQFQGEFNTKVIPVPEGEYTAVIEELKGRDTASGPVLDVVWNIDSPEAKAATGRDKITITQGVFLKFSAGGALDSEQNQQLARVRDAIGQNTGGAWSPQMMVGQVARVRVGHKPGKEGTGDVYANITAVTKV